MPNPRFSHHVGLELATEPVFESGEAPEKMLFFGLHVRLSLPGTTEQRKKQSVISKNLEILSAFSYPAPVGLDC